MNKFTFPFLTLLVLAGACSKDPVTPNTSISQRDVVLNYATIVSASYSDAIIGIQNLKIAIDAFVKAPSATGLETCKKAWLDARPSYLQTEAYRFYGGPIDATPAELEGLINSWPLDEAKIDYVEGNLNSGMINDLTTYPTITKDAIFKSNGEGGETDVRVGYHAIEFLLWGQDLYANSPGKRPYTDYTTAKNATRRAAYLQVVTNALIENLQEVATQWDSKTGAYYAEFTKAGGETTALTNMLLGMGKLTKGELSGERMTVALASGDQEDEHSCFSDNTTNDFIYDELGVYNVYVGQYKRIDGTTIDGAGIDDLVKAKSTTQNTAMMARLDAATAAISAIPKPFDQAILNAKTSIQTAVKALRDQSDEFVLVAKEIGINLNIPEEN